MFTWDLISIVFDAVDTEQHPQVQLTEIIGGGANNGS